MNRYCLIREIKEEHVEDYKNLHLNPWPEIPKLIKECGCEELIIYKHNNLVVLYFECEEIDKFYKKYSAYPEVQKWNEIMDTWIKASPSLDGKEHVETLEKIFDATEQLQGC